MTNQCETQWPLWLQPRGKFPLPEAYVVIKKENYNGIKMNIINTIAQRSDSIIALTHIVLDREHCHLVKYSTHSILLSHRLLQRMAEHYNHHLTP